MAIPSHVAGESEAGRGGHVEDDGVEAFERHRRMIVRQETVVDGTASSTEARGAAAQRLQLEAIGTVPDQDRLGGGRHLRPVLFWA